jgi:hypothetical protein
MIDRKVPSCAAVLALEIVALEYILPGKINALVGGVHIAVEADYRRHRKALGDRTQPVPIGRLYQFTFFQVYQYKCTLDGTNHERAGILIQNQHPVDHDGNIESIFQVTKPLYPVFPEMEWLTG